MVNKSLIPIMIELGYTGRVTDDRITFGILKLEYNHINNKFLVMILIVQGGAKWFGEN